MTPAVWGCPAQSAESAPGTDLYCRKEKELTQRAGSFFCGRVPKDSLGGRNERVNDICQPLCAYSSFLVWVLIPTTQKIIIDLCLFCRQKELCIPECLIKQFSVILFSPVFNRKDVDKPPDSETTCCD